MDHINLEDIIDYKFRDASLLQSALIHPSFRKKAREFERLEFLGDRVLGLVVASWVFKDFPTETEGDLAKRLAALVRKEACGYVAQVIRMNDFVQASKSDFNGYTAIFSDAVEALIGAMFLDGGLQPCQRFIKNFWAPLLEKYKAPPKDAKSMLQEWAQSHNKPVPSYQVVEVTGPDHAPYFHTKVSIVGYDSVRGSGETKRLAEQDAASHFLELLVGQKIRK